ncbi:MAG: aldo/keto reductase [Spirochaetota bacterium]
MKMLSIPNTDLTVSRISYGCMKLASIQVSPSDLPKAAVDACLAAYEAGINFFDNADIYGRGRCEELFSGIWKHVPREKIVLQTKCGIRPKDTPTAGLPGRYDFSFEHITRSVEESLTRLKTDHIDILLLHRPDALMSPEEVARAFDELHASGKVRYFGVSNHNVMQMELIRKYVKRPIVANQMQLSVMHHYLVSEGVLVNIALKPAGLATGILDYCRLNNISVQAWSPVARGVPLMPAADAPAHIKELSEYIRILASQKNTSPEAILLAWVMRHPAVVIPIIGTVNISHIKGSALADAVVLSREEWYHLLALARGESVP